MKKFLSVLLICILMLSVTVNLCSCDDISGLLGNTGGETPDNGEGNEGTEPGPDGGIDSGDDGFDYSDGDPNNTGSGIELPTVPAPESPLPGEEGEEDAEQN